MKTYAILTLLIILSALAASACSDSSDNVADGDMDQSEQDEAVEVEPDTDGDPDGDLDAEEIDKDVNEIEELEDEPEQEIPELEAEAEVEEIEPEALLWEILTSSAPTVRSILGVSTHMQQSEGENVKRDFEFEKYVELGGIRIREDFHWHKIEPADDQWDFARVDTQVQMAKARNMKVLPMLAYTVDWAMTEEGNTSSIDPELYGQYAGKVAETYCDDIKEYEIWNEPNFARFWAPEPDLAHYAKFLKAAYIAIKAACPDARVMTAGISSFDFLGFFDRWWVLDDMVEAEPDICDYFDIFALHPYTQMQKTSPEYDYELAPDKIAEGQIEMTRLARQKLKDIGCDEKGIWYTETGWPSLDLINDDDIVTTGHDNEDVQGLYLPRSILLAARDDVEAYFWYTFWDSSPNPDDWRPHEAYFGLFNYYTDESDNYIEKPSYKSLKGLADVVGDARFVRDLSKVLELPNDVFVLLFAEDDGTLVLAMWDGRDLPDITLDEGVLEGGWDTSYLLQLPLIEDLTDFEFFNILGEKEEADPPTQNELSITLTHEIRYLVIER